MRGKPYLMICGLTALFAAGLLVYSQTGAFAWDEGFHLLTAQLIKNGKRPYLDFFFPQTPLNAYWNALWFRLFGDTWRVAHVAAALCTTGAIFLLGDYVYRRFPVLSWRLAGAMIAMFAAGFNAMIIEFGAIAQAYGFCLVFVMAAFRFTVLAVEESGIWCALLGGLMVGMSSGASLLTSLAGPVMLVWILYYNRAGSRIAKFIAFGAGHVIPFAPLIWFYVQKPREVLFTVLQFNARYRSVGWADATSHDIEALSSLLVSSQATMLLVLAIAGLFYVSQRSGWDRGTKGEFYLCAWLPVILGVHIATAHPTFERYYLFTVPFLSILAVAGIYWLTTALASEQETQWPVILVAVFFSLGLSRALFVDENGALRWKDLEKIADKVAEVTPPGVPIWSEEHFYFLTRRVPPVGMEHENSHKPLGLSDEFTKSLHILPGWKMQDMVRKGYFGTVVVCDDLDEGVVAGLPNTYEESEEIGDCTVYWDKKKP